MNKLELLSLAKEWGVSKATLAALDHASSYEAAEARLATLDRRRPILTKVNALLSVAITVALLGALWQTKTHMTVAKDIIAAFFFCLVVFPAMGFCFEFFVSESLCGMDERARLKKIEGTADCDLALGYAEKSTWASAWRHIAVEERMALRNLDCKIMMALSAEQSQRDEKIRLDAACKKLHGIPEAAEA